MAEQGESNARVERLLYATWFATVVAGEEPTAEDIAGARRVLLGQTTTEEEIRNGLAELEERYGFVR